MCLICGKKLFDFCSTLMDFTYLQHLYFYYKETEDCELKILTIKKRKKKEIFFMDMNSFGALHFWEEIIIVVVVIVTLLLCYFKNVVKFNNNIRLFLTAFCPLVFFYSIVGVKILHIKSFFKWYSTFTVWRDETDLFPGVWQVELWCGIASSLLLSLSYFPVLCYIVTSFFFSVVSWSEFWKAAEENRQLLRPLGLSVGHQVRYRVSLHPGPAEYIRPLHRR